MPQDKGFFGSLFDLSFQSLVATKLIKVLYVWSLIVIGLTAVLFAAVAFSFSGVLGAFVLFVLAPMFSLLYVVYTRVVLEFFMAVFRIVENGRDLLALARGQGAAVEGGAAPGPRQPEPATQPWGA